MKSINPFAGAAILLTAVLFSSTSPATAAKPEFETLAGRYKASYLLVTGPSTISSNNLEVTVTVPKNGARATMRIVGFAVASTGGPPLTVAMLGNLNFFPQKVSADNALLAFYIQLPAAGLSAGSKHRQQFTLTNSSAAIGSPVTMTYTFNFSKKRFSIIGSGLLGASPTSVTLKATRRGK